MDQDEPSIFAAESNEMYSAGQFVRAVVTHVHMEGERARPQLGERPSNDEEWQCGKIELSLVPQKVNEGLTQDGLASGVVSNLSFVFHREGRINVQCLDSVRCCQECRGSRIRHGLWSS